jgi:Coenzyme PQQ synthesis protein D (PqqD).
VSEDGIVTILEKQEHKVQKFFRKLKFRIPEYKRISMDEYGSYVFLQIDGIKTVEAIGENLEAKYGDKANPLYERLLLFLNHLEVNCRYIEKSKFLIKKDGAAL